MRWRDDVIAELDTIGRNGLIALCCHERAIYSNL